MLKKTVMLLSIVTALLLPTTAYACSSVNPADSVPPAATTAIRETRTDTPVFAAKISVKERNTILLDVLAISERKPGSLKGGKTPGEYEEFIITAPANFVFSGNPSVTGEIAFARDFVPDKSASALLLPQSDSVTVRLYNPYFAPSGSGKNSVGRIVISGLTMTAKTDLVGDIIVMVNGNDACGIPSQAIKVATRCDPGRLELELAEPPKSGKPLPLISISPTDTKTFSEQHDIGTVLIREVPISGSYWAVGMMAVLEPPTGVKIVKAAIANKENGSTVIQAPQNNVPPSANTIYINSDGFLIIPFLENTISYEPIKVNLWVTIDKSFVPIDGTAKDIAIKEIGSMFTDYAVGIAMAQVSNKNFQSAPKTTEVRVSVGSPFITVDGEQIPIADGAAYISQNSESLMVPVRFVALALGVDSDAIDWNDNTKTVTIATNGKTVQFTGGLGSMRLNGNEIAMIGESGKSVVPEIKDGRIYVPFRQVGRAFGFDTDWDKTPPGTAIFRK